MFKEIEVSDVEMGKLKEILENLDRIFEAGAKGDDEPKEAQKEAQKECKCLTCQFERLVNAEVENMDETDKGYAVMQERVKLKCGEDLKSWMDFYRIVSSKQEETRRELKKIMREYEGGKVVLKIIIEHIAKLGASENKS